MIYKNVIKCITTLFIFLTVSPLLSQKVLKVKIELPSDMEIDNVSVYLDNGKTVSKIKKFEKVGTSKLILIDTFYSSYAVINLQYKKEPKGILGNTFFVTEDPATIILEKPGSSSTSLENYKLVNAYDFKKERAELTKWDSIERNKALDFETKNHDNIFIKNDTAVRRHYFGFLRKNLSAKRLDYIKAHANSYYAFYIFRTEIAINNPFNTVDSLITAYNTIFPDKFKYSDEGNFLNEYLHGKRSFSAGSPSVTFTSKDVYGKLISLLSFREKKYVMLHFWATWCTPCIEEIPKIKEFSQRFGSDDLAIISIAYQSPEYSNFMNVIRKYKMDWYQIYNDIDINNKFGNAPIPRVCLIDKTGKVIYDNIDGDSVERQKLSKLEEILLKSIE